MSLCTPAHIEYSQIAATEASEAGDASRCVFEDFYNLVRCTGRLHSFRPNFLSFGPPCVSSYK
jgi:hypothetical protein